jgi:hypothetical protein
MLLTEKNGIEQIEIEDVNGFFYFPMPQEEMWRTEQLMTMMEERKHNKLDATDIELFKFLCTD